VRFDGELMRQNGRRSHLFSTSSFLDGWEHHRSYWVLGTGDFSRTPVSYPWIVSKSLAVPYGLMLALDERTVYGVHRSAAKRGKGGYTLFAAPRPDPSDDQNSLPDFAKRSAKKGLGDNTWTTALPLRPRAMIRAGNALLVGGMAPAGQGSVLRVVSAADGETLADVPLGSPPVWDGMAAADERLYVSLEDGTVICLGGSTAQ
jgi:hypothetical protein